MEIETDVMTMAAAVVDAAAVVAVVGAVDTADAADTAEAADTGAEEATVDAAADRCQSP